MKKISIWPLIINIAFIFVYSLTASAQGDLPDNPYIIFPSEDFIQTYDKNGDGKMTKTEFPGFKPVWDILDNNNDGIIDMSDVSSSVKFSGPREIIFIKLFDKGDDGKISKTEFPTDEEDWDFLDADKDGFIDIDEAREGQDSQIIHFFIPTEGNQ